MGSVGCCLGLVLTRGGHRAEAFQRYTRGQADSLRQVSPGVIITKRHNCDRFSYVLTLLCQNPVEVSAEVADDSLFGVARAAFVLRARSACSTRARSSCRAVVLPLDASVQ